MPFGMDFGPFCYSHLVVRLEKAHSLDSSLLYYHARHTLHVFTLLSPNEDPSLLTLRPEVVIA